LTEYVARRQTDTIIPTFSPLVVHRTPHSSSIHAHLCLSMHHYAPMLLPMYAFPRSRQRRQEYELYDPNKSEKLALFYSLSPIYSYLPGTGDWPVLESAVHSLLHQWSHHPNRLFILYNALGDYTKHLHNFSAPSKQPPSLIVFPHLSIISLLAIDR